jgi:uncharacterized protein YdaU (DUF1376 family)
MQLYVADYLADTAHLTAAQHGAYLLLIFNYWQRGKPLNNSNERLANVARMSNEEWICARPILEEFFEVDGDEWMHMRIEHDLHTVNSKSGKASKAGKASAARRSSGCATNVERTLNHKDVDTDTDKDVNLKPSCTTGVVLAHPTLHKPKDAQVDLRIPADSGFEQFWAAFPKRKNRGRAEKTWAKIKPNAELVAVMLSAIASAKAGADWKKDGGQYVPYPETWLNAKGWQDDVSVAGYGLGEVSVMEQYDIIMVDGCGWAEVSMTPYSLNRAVAIREFLTFSDKQDWVKKYFEWVANNLEFRDGCGFDWVIRKDIFLRVKEGNFSALKGTA